MFHTFAPCCQIHIHALLIRHKVETVVSANAVVMAGLIKSWCSVVWNIALVLAAVSGLSCISIISSTNIQQKEKLFHVAMQ